MYFLALYLFKGKGKCEYAKTSEKGHGCYETRECYAAMDSSWLPQKKRLGRHMRDRNAGQRKKLH
ncbi:hypothetical protein HMPREF1548_02358 [Clostridium sp. KLE 1755]|uniref:Uncharacterized protein n=1 Tax=Eisenbergiella massiliensis TaxID=1720294 RepID=A0A3E3IF54_9FIRM|nr:hypothetical protein HMPREF1548_02358 [Clostridium sp. KLE 1755]RGE65656.1 hypothetical protein DWY69_25395 [Eisenbergiella massiliensis]